MKAIVKILKNGGVVVMPTDTIYGIVGQAQNRATVERIYKIKGRAPAKPFIVLISDYSDLDLFGINLTAQNRKVLKNYWPGPVSVILSLSDNFDNQKNQISMKATKRNTDIKVSQFCAIEQNCDTCDTKEDKGKGEGKFFKNDNGVKDKYYYLHRGEKTLAFRMPAVESLRGLIKESGPLVAPSANPQGLEPAKNINKAKEYFGNKIDFYVDGGEISSHPSKIIDLTNGFKVIRD